MKNLPLHILYLSIISFLSYQFWSKTTSDTRAFEQTERAMKHNDIFFNEYRHYFEREIDKFVKAYPVPKAVEYLKRVENIKKVSEDKMQWIDGQIVAIKQQKTVKLTEINDSMQDLTSFLINSVDEEERNSMSKQFGLPTLMNVDSLSDGIKHHSSLYLTVLKNQIQQDVMAYLHYAYMKTGPDIDMRFDAFRVAIAPRQATMIIGETFEADVYLTNYSSSIYNHYKMASNGIDLPIRNGVAHYTKVEKTLGKQTFKAQCLYKHPLTGENRLYEGSFEYLVLPKCSTDCH